MPKLVLKFVFFSFLNFVFLLSYLDENLLNIRPSKSDMAVIMYTSGSTGTPKGSISFEKLTQ